MAEEKGQTDSCRGCFEDGSGAMTIWFSDVDGIGAMTELIFMLELNGPMADLESDLIDGFNGMIARLREERTDILVWLWKEIDHCIDNNNRIYCTDYSTRVPITEDSALIEQGCFTHLRTLVEEYRRAHPEEFIHQDNVRGSGCLFGCGGSIDLVQQEYRRTRPEERPMRTMIVIVTDNAKIEPESGDYWTPDRLRELVQQQEEEGWAFILLGANIDAAQVVGDLGIPAENAAQFACDAAGVRENFASLGAMILEFSATGVVAPTWARKISDHLAKTQSGRS